MPGQCWEAVPQADNQDAEIESTPNPSMALRDWVRFVRSVPLGKGRILDPVISKDVSRPDI